MMKTTRNLFFVAAMAGLAVAAQAAESQTPRSGADSATTAGFRDGQRVIVVLKEAPGAGLTGTESRAAEQAYTAALRSTQTAVIDAVFGSTARVTAAPERSARLFDIVPMFAINASAAEVAKLKADPRVARVEPDQLSKPTLLDSLPLINMTGSSGAYSLGAAGAGRVVVVTDTGVNKTHEFLKNKVIAEACFNSTVSADGATSRCPGGVHTSTAAGSGADCGPAQIEGCGHGTHVAGIAAGFNTSISANEPLNGVAKSAKIMAINVFSRFNKNSGNCGSGATKDCVLSYTSDQIAALQYVKSKNRLIGANVIDAINMSIGGSHTTTTCNTDTRAAVINALRNQGVATVIAAGNDYYVDSVSFPGCIQNAITVAATSKRTTGKPERVSIYSNISPVVDVFAPGGDFNYPFNTARDQIRSSYGGGYGNLAGTSMATPHVAGAIAAMRSRAACKTKTVGQIETALRTSGLAITDWRPAFYSIPVPAITKRRMDVRAAMHAMGCAP